MSDPELKKIGPSNGNNAVSVLVCDSDEAYRGRLTEMLAQEQPINFQVREASDASQIESELADEVPDIILLDLNLPEKSALELLREIHTAELAPVVIIAADGNEQLAVESMKSGAYDYIAKSHLTPENLVQSIVEARENWKLTRETEELQADLAHMAMYDALTEVLSRRAILEHIEAEIQRTMRYKRDLSLLLVDIDLFKDVNDTYGHVAGDAVLREVAQSLKFNTRRSDFVGRYGGEEFLVVLPETTQNKALVLAEKLRARVAQLTVPLDGKVIGGFTVSIGAATYEDDLTVEALVHRSDEWMYKAKEKGRNQVQPAPSKAN